MNSENPAPRKSNFSSPEDKQLAETLIKKGAISKDNIKEALKKQKLVTFQGNNNPTLADIIVSEGFLEKDEVDAYFPQSQANATELGGFKLIKKIGNGGMGSVYRARQISMSRDVAVKLISRDKANNQNFIKRFYREAHAAARLSHDNIVSAIDVGEDKSRHYFAMELVNGMSLKDLMDECHDPLSEKYCLHVVRQVVLGLKHATEHNIIHRDIKPDNILLTSRDNSEDPHLGTLNDVVKIVDLGIAKLNDQENTMITQAGAAMGTPHYISPEQALGEQNIDFRTDIYSLGATLFHMVTGVTPFQGDSAIKIVMAHIQKEPPTPRELVPEISNTCDALIQRMMAKDKNERFNSHQELLDSIQHTLRTDSSDTSPKKNVKMILRLLMVVLPIAVISTIVSVMSGGDGNEEKPKKGNVSIHANGTLRKPHDQNILKVNNKAYEKIKKWLQEVDYARYRKISLEDIKNLRSLNLKQTTLSQFELSLLENLENLEKLDLSLSNVDNESLEIVKDLKSLKQLKLNGTRVDGRGVGLLKDMPELENLGIIKTNVSTKEFENFKEFPKLNTLHIGSNKIDHHCLVALKNVPLLKSLNISNMNITNLWLYHISALSNLEEIIIQNAEHIDGKGLVNLIKLEKLKALHLFEAKEFRTLSMRSISRMTQLEELSITTAPKLSHYSLIKLAELKNLNYLDLSGCSGLKYAKEKRLSYISQLRNLTHLNLSLTKINSDELKKLQAKLPTKCRLIR